MQVIEATAAVVETNHRGNCCSNRLCSMLSAILSTISLSMGCDVMAVILHPSHLIHMCLDVRREEKSQHQTGSALSNKQSAVLFVLNKQGGCERTVTGYTHTQRNIFHSLSSTFMQPSSSAFNKCCRFFNQWQITGRKLNIKLLMVFK